MLYLKKLKKNIKSHLNAVIKKIIQSLQLSNDPKRWRTFKKEMIYLRKGSSDPHLDNDTVITKTEQEKLKQFSRQYESVFGANIKFKDKDLE